MSKDRYTGSGGEIRGPFIKDPTFGIRNGEGRCAVTWPTCAEEQVIFKALNRAWKKQQRERGELA